MKHFKHEDKSVFLSVRVIQTITTGGGVQSEQLANAAAHTHS